ncbi:Reverse transcriptase, RNA-dependent DNA polymerase [Penicillium camemberti]|uniref:Reverse transcriptase, RNA-dependent DNA polymerase n=1 Tax=Penicillium camemberti (strain FM 013) TaxID=1429867 RepID=A0A0G4P7F7_PENC3|nr:Reverse transcriptase, RNA-dependent DNA polymerase [Penicillium camemberti]
MLDCIEAWPTTALTTKDTVINKTRKYSPDYEKLQPILILLIKEPEEITIEEVTQHDAHEVDEEPRDAPPESPIQQALGAAYRHTTPLQGVERAYIPTPAGLPHTFLTPVNQLTPVRIKAQEQDDAPKDQSPPLTPSSDATEPDQGVDMHGQDDQLLARDQAQQHEEEAIPAVEDELERQLQAELLAPSREITSSVDASNILSGRRTRRARKDDDFAYATTMQPLDEEPPALLHAFAAGLYAEKPDCRRHRDNLPPPPKHWKDVINHPFQQGFLAVIKKEIHSLFKKETVEIFTYKFDQNGFLVKFKARIYIRGDLETITHKEKRAATLTARTVRIIFTLVAAFNLDLRQRDTVTTFLNSKLSPEQEVYTHIPEGFQSLDRLPVYTPLPVDDLTPYKGTATPQEILLYQKKVGSASYTTTITRPDAAKATYSADAASTADSIQFISNASYRDHSDRKSSAGYICQAYNGPINWKATKQPTVTTSTTEAELLGLSEAGKQVQWWRRLMNSLGFVPSHDLTIDCDNERTIGLLTSEDTAFETKLRHVDIHHHWLRQEVQEKRINVRWVATASMVADGLTKLLSKQKHEGFVRMLRMVDIGYLIA